MKSTNSLIQLFIILFASILLASCSSVGTNGTPNLLSLPTTHDQVALLLPLHGSFAEPGGAVRNGFLAGYYAQLRQGQSNSSVQIYDTSTTTNICKLYSRAVKNGAKMVIGPLTKPDVNALINCGGIKVPTIALNYVNNNNPPRLLFEFGISPENEASQVATKALSAGLSKAIIIAPSANWGRKMVNAFSKQWQQNGGTIVDTLYYSPNTNLRSAIQTLLKVPPRKDYATQHIPGDPKALPAANASERRQDFDSIFLVASPQYGREIVPLLAYYYAGNIPTYSTSMIYNGTTRINFNRDMDGVIFDDIPWIFNSAAVSHIQENISQLWPANYKSYVRLYALGLDAFSLTLHLNQLLNNPIAGNTGELYLGSHHQILQKFSWAQFKYGKARQIK